MGVGPDGLWVVEQIPSPVHRRAIREVPDVVDEFQFTRCLLGLCIHPSLCREDCGACLLLPVERCSLNRGLARVAELLLPARVDLIRVLLEGQECALDFLMSFCILNDAIAEAHIPVGPCLPELP